MKICGILRGDFLPANANLGLLVLRLWLGLSIARLHGWSKLISFSKMHAQFADPFGIGPGPSLALSVLAEFFCGLLLALGLFTRPAALILVINMSVAFFGAHHAVLTGGHSGELAYLYLAGFFTLLVAGAGRYSLDAVWWGKRAGTP